jgi:hypothetical protein
MGDSPAELKDYHVMKLQTFAGGGGSSTQLFQVKGIVTIKHIYGVVKVNLSADVDNVSLDLFPTGGALVALATLVDSASAPAGSLFVKERDAGEALVLKSSVVPFVFENTTFNKPFVQTIIGAQGDGTATFVRATYSGVATSGAILWMVDWEQESGNGLLEVA